MRRRKWVTALVVIVLTAVGAGAAPPAARAATLGGVDMQAACNNQYPGYGTRAVVTDPASAYSWRCTTSTASYGIDVNRACVAQHGSGASAGVRSTSDPYSWYCHRPSCVGAACVGRNPGGTDCSATAAPPLETVTVRGGGATVGLRWSSYCRANWARWVSGTSSPGYWDYWVETWDGHRQGKTFPAGEWTFMVNGDLLARACIRGNYDPTPACTRWY
jgi:hypothetical protein